MMEQLFLSCRALSSPTLCRFIPAFSLRPPSCKRVLHGNPDDMRAHTGLAATYSLSGREEEASGAAAEVLRLDPKFSLEHVAKALPFKDKTDTELYIDSLRKAGLK